ncbi:Alpha-glucosidase [Phytophthora nicotianae]|nr:Alpha-glucosidase [Phytophthora nicotianae]
MIESGIRDAGPYEVLIKITAAEMERCSRRELAVLQWKKEGRILTPYAKDLWEKERARVGEYSVRRSSDTVYFTVHAGTSRSRRVDISMPSCSCPTSDQLKIACRHINAVLEHVKLPEKNLDAFHKSYLVTTNVHAFVGKGIELPIRDTDHVDPNVKPSPFYKQAGRRVTRRMGSSGESAGNTYKCKTCSEKGHNRRTCKRHGNDADEANADLIPSPVHLPSLSLQLGEHVRPLQPQEVRDQDDFSAANRHSRQPSRSASWCNRG